MSLGTDLAVAKDLIPNYDAVLLAYGASDAADLSVPGANEAETRNYFNATLR